MAPLVTFYFEFASPYSYLAAADIDERVGAVGGEVDWKPVDIFKIWDSQGIRGAYLQVRRAKLSYIERDAQRCAAVLGVRFNPPAKSASDTRLAKLAYWGLREARDDRAKPFLKSVWQHYFTHGQAITDAADLAAAAISLCLTAAEIETLANGGTTAMCQAEANRQAIVAGCFGIPWFQYGADCYFGHDRVDQLIEAISQRSVPGWSADRSGTGRSR